MSTLKDRIKTEMIEAMRAKNTERLGVIRLLQAAIKQIEIDERIELDDRQVLAIIDKMVKQRRDSIKQYENAGRKELADQEAFEITILQEYLPTQLSDDEIDAMVKNAIDETGAADMKAMGQVMAILKPKLQGRADIGTVSGKVKSHLT